MTTRRMVLRVEELGTRVLPSATVPVPAPSTTAAKAATAEVTTVAVPSLASHGRFSATSPVSGTGKSYTFEGSAQFGNLGFFAVKGSIQTVGNIRSGQAHGRITLTNGRGTLTLDLTGPMQTSFAALPTKFNYRVLSGTGVFAHYAGQGTVQLSTQLFLGYSTRGHFDMLIRPTA